MRTATLHSAPTVCHTIGLLPLVAMLQVYAPGRIRTSDQQLRRLLLYPPELRARNNLASYCPARMPHSVPHPMPPRGAGCDAPQTILVDVCPSSRATVNGATGAPA